MMAIFGKRAKDYVSSRGEERMLSSMTTPIASTAIVVAVPSVDTHARNQIATFSLAVDQGGTYVAVEVTQLLQTERWPRVDDVIRVQYDAANPSVVVIDGASIPDGIGRANEAARRLNDA